mmetsp:Transcript_45894/g.132931  ORF Transcript_45894/g.132931 Transcript_45894/m.132931 type:complete len:215 (-) Transcript_45894:1319-1963(-)
MLAGGNGQVSVTTTHSQALLAVSSVMCPAVLLRAMPWEASPAGVLHLLPLAMPPTSGSTGAVPRHGASRRPRAGAERPPPEPSEATSEASCPARPLLTAARPRSLVATSAHGARAPPAAAPSAAPSEMLTAAAARHPGGPAGQRGRTPHLSWGSSRRPLQTRGCRTLPAMLPRSRMWRCAAPARCPAAGAPGTTWRSHHACAPRSSRPASLRLP